MANFPIANYRIPMSWNIDNTTFIVHNDTKFCVHSDGSMSLEGNVKDAAYALFKYVFEKEYALGLIQISLNYGIIIYCENQIRLELYNKEKPAPEFWDELVIEFDRIVKMKVFW